MAGPHPQPAIAIVGWACRFPGASSPEQLWQLLASGADPIREVPPDRWDIDALYDPAPRTPSKMNSRWGGFLDDVDAFDAEFFGIRPREACSIDPQQRMLLEVSWHALEDAGIVPARLAGEPVGVFFGASNWDYNKIINRDLALQDAYTAAGTALSIASNRVSFALDLRGPSITVDTACSSSLVALHWACHSLRAGESTLALAGAVNLILSPEASIVLSQSSMLSPGGRSRAFDERADGFVRSEACGVLVLKRLDDAQADGDRILGVVRGTAVNHNGASNGLFAPNGRAQESLLRQTLAQAGIAPGEPSLVEAQGTGTPLGDLIEVRALKAVLLEGRAAGERCAITSVKTNIGHTEAVSGIAGVMRVLLSMQHGVITRNLHLQALNPHIASTIEGTPLFFPTQTSPWPTSGSKLAVVSSFGFGGANAQAIVEQAPPTAAGDAELAGSGDASRSHGPRLHALVLSARTGDALRELARSYAAYLAAHPDVALDDVCFTASTGRSRFAHRLGAVAAAVGPLRQQLNAFAAGHPAENLWAAQRTGSRSPNLVLHFTDAPAAPQAAAALELARRWLAWGVRPVAVTGDGSGERIAVEVAGALGAQLAPADRHSATMHLAISSDTVTLSSSAAAADRQTLVRGSLGDSELQTRYRCLAALAAHGVDVDWRAVHAGLSARRIALPTYPFQRQRYWVGRPV